MVKDIGASFLVVFQKARCFGPQRLRNCDSCVDVLEQLLDSPIPAAFLNFAPNIAEPRQRGRSVSDLQAICKLSVPSQRSIPETASPVELFRHSLSHNTGQIREGQDFRFSDSPTAHNNCLQPLPSCESRSLKC